MKEYWLPCPKCGAVTKQVHWIEIVNSIAVFHCPCGEKFKTQAVKDTGVIEYYKEIEWKI